MSIRILEKRTSVRISEGGGAQREQPAKSELSWLPLGTGEKRAENSRHREETRRLRERWWGQAEPAKKVGGTDADFTLALGHEPISKEWTFGLTGSSMVLRRRRSAAASLATCIVLDKIGRAHV